MRCGERVPVPLQVTERLWHRRACGCGGLSGAALPPEVVRLRQRNKELEMQLDILKQAAVIMARKEK